MNKFFNGYSCINCNSQFNKKFLYSCPFCNNNLDASYDYAEIKKLNIKNLLQLNPDKNLSRYNFFYPGSYIYSSKFLNMTPLLRAENLAKKFSLKNLFLKDDTRQPSFSFKDRATAIVIDFAKELNIDTIATASTGNAGASLACLSAKNRIKAVIFVPENAPTPKILQIRIYGAKLFKIDGNYDKAYEVCKKICMKKNWFNRSTGLNPITREGKKTVSFEIWEQLNFEVPDFIFVPVGDGNIISGVWKGFKDLYNSGAILKLPKLIGVQAKGSNAIFKAFENYKKTKKIIINPVNSNTIADSISVDLPKDGLSASKAVIESNGEVYQVSDDEILSSQYEVARIEGLFVEPSASATVAGLKKFLSSNKKITGKEKIVLLITGCGLKSDNVRLYKFFD